VAHQSLRKHGAVLIAASSAQGLEWTNRIAPEHLTTTREKLPYILSAGSIFLGDILRRLPVTTDQGQSRAADRRRGALPGRAECIGLRKNRDGAGNFALGFTRDRTSILTLANCRRAECARPVIELRCHHA